MNIFDPTRPKGPNGKPQYFGPNGPIGPIPHLCLAPNTDGTWDVAILLLTEPSVGRWFCTTVTANALLPLLCEYRDDPEGCMRSAFGYLGCVVPRNAPAETLDLEDL